MKFDYLIKDGFVIDGTDISVGIRQTDVGIVGERIEAVGKLSDATAENFIDARGRYVCPGFIDTHSHSEFTLLADGRAEGKICQGITTEINGNCGLSAAPLFGPAFEHREIDLKEFGIKERWNTLSEYFEILGKKRHAVNFLTLVGHGNLRASVVGYSDRGLSKEETNKAFHLLKDAMDSGAKGLSTGLMYSPGVYADTNEIIALAHEVAVREGIYTTHMRSEGDKLLESIKETIKVGLSSGVRVHISHLKTSGERNWKKINEVFKLIDKAHQQGLNMTFDRYPYTASCTGLDAILPSWTYEGGRENELERIKSKRQRITEEIFKRCSKESYWEKVKISSVGSDRNKWMEGKSLFEVSRSLKRTPLDFLFEILIDEKLQVEAIFFLMNEDNLKLILKSPFTMIGTDSSARSFDGITAKGKPHPRGFGSFPRILSKYVREEKLLSIEEAIYKMTGLPAKTFGIKQRGAIVEGFYADITVFDANKIADNADFENPFKKPDGIYYVFVNGKPVVRDGVPTGALPGRILK